MTRLLSDDRLARRAAAGDERAFAAIFGRYHQDLYRYCLAIVGNPEDAQDALQNAMVKVLRALPGEKREIQLKPWLYRVAHNESIDLLRRRRETRELDPALAAPGSGLAEEAATRERLRGLIADLDELPEQQRGALVMRELSGLGLDEIGVALGTSTAVARQTLFEARRSLRQMAEGREMGCETVSRVLSDGDGRVTRRRDVRAHLRACASCRHFGEGIAGRKHDLAALAGLPAVAAAGILQGLIGGGGGGAGGGGLAAALGGGAANSVGAAAVFKGVALVGVVGAVGVGAAERGGLVDLGLAGGREGEPRGVEVRHAAWSVGPAQARSHPARIAASTRTSHRPATPGAAADGAIGASKAGPDPSAEPPAGGSAGARAESPGTPVGPEEIKASPTAEGAGESVAGGATGPAGQGPAPEGEGSAAPGSGGSEESPAGQGDGQGQGNGQGQGQGHGKGNGQGTPPQSNGKGPEKEKEPPEKGPPPSPPGQEKREEHSQAPGPPPGQASEGPPGQESPPGQGNGNDHGKGKKSEVLP